MLVIFVVFAFSCKEKKKKYNSDFIVNNKTSTVIDVYSSSYVVNSNGPSNLVSKTDYVEANSAYIIKNMDASEDVAMSVIFQEIRIFRDNVECTKEELSNTYWVKTRISDDKFSYTLAIDSTFFY